MPAPAKPESEPTFTIVCDNGTGGTFTWTGVTAQGQHTIVCATGFKAWITFAVCQVWICWRHGSSELSLHGRNLP